MTDTARLNSDKVFFGITPTSWWNDDFLDIDIGIPFEQCVSEMALAGYSGCSVGHKFPADIAVLKQELALRGLRVSEPWTSLYFTIADMHGQTLADFEKSLEFIAALGGTHIVVAELGGSSHVLPVALVPNRRILDDAEWAALCAGLNTLGAIAQKRGMTVCYHHHMGTGVMTRADVDRLAANTDPQLVHLLLDTGHMLFAGGDPLALARDYAPRIKHVHLKNIRRPVMERALAENLSFKQAILAGIFTVPGDPEGCIDYAPILHVLAESGFEGWIMVEAEQDPAHAKPLHYAKMGRDYLRQIAGF